MRKTKECGWTLCEALKVKQKICTQNTRRDILPLSSRLNLQWCHVFFIFHVYLFHANNHFKFLGLAYM